MLEVYQYVLLWVLVGLCVLLNFEIHDRNQPPVFGRWFEEIAIRVAIVSLWPLAIYLVIRK